MSYASLMVHLDLGVSNEALLGVAGGLAERLKAAAIGVAACTPMQIFAGDAYISGELFDQDRIETDRLINEAEQGFYAALKGRASEVKWRSMVAFAALADVLANESRGADLFIIAPDPKGGETEFDPARRVRTGDLIMSLGRPTLLAPPTVKSPDLDRAIIGWKDTRETRRAVSDAMPLLEQARRVTVLEIAKADEQADAKNRLAEVCGWLKRHGVEAEPLVKLSTGDDFGQIVATVRELQAGLLVAGAYGHSRVREWALGGVTRDLLLHAPCLCLLSH
jgi:nucleotide-binding universal stress UspA family protein